MVCFLSVVSPLLQRRHFLSLSIYRIQKYLNALNLLIRPTSIIYLDNPPWNISDSYRIEQPRLHTFARGLTFFGIIGLLVWVWNLLSYRLKRVKTFKGNITEWYQRKQSISLDILCYICGSNIYMPASCAQYGHDICQYLYPYTSRCLYSCSLYLCSFVSRYLY